MCGVAANPAMSHVPKKGTANLGAKGYASVATGRRGNRTSAFECGRFFAFASDILTWRSSDCTPWHVRLIRLEDTSRATRFVAEHRQVPSRHRRHSANLTGCDGRDPTRQERAVFPPVRAIFGSTPSAASLRPHPCVSAPSPRGRAASGGAEAIKRLTAAHTRSISGVACARRALPRRPSKGEE